MSKSKKSPLKAKPLRNPGQSLDEQLIDIVYDKMLSWFVVLTLMLVMTGSEWQRWYFDKPLNPWGMTYTATPIVLFCLYRIYVLFHKARKLKLGRDGERIVGQYLEQIRNAGDRVFHDIVGDQFNLDHVIISTHGIFIVETKTYSKPANGKAEIYFDGKAITIDKGINANKLIDQARAQKSWLIETLKESTGKTFPVKTIIVFPGWYINATNKAFDGDVWVLNPKGLSTFINNTPEQIILEDQQLATFHLSRYIRSN
jgi:hypothetical protein